MKTAVVFALFLACAVPALAQEWQEYQYPDRGFSASFPGEPAIRETSYKLPNGAVMPARLYSLNQGANEYRIIVADFSNAPVKDDAAIDQAAEGLRATGQVSVDIQARVRRNFGRQLALTTKDGSHSVAAIFFVNNQLFQIEGITHPQEGSTDSSRAVRFQQSLDFIGGTGGYFGRRVPF